jgi:hypothetical protein
MILLLGAVIGAFLPVLLLLFPFIMIVLWIIAISDAISDRRTTDCRPDYAERIEQLLLAAQAAAAAAPASTPPATAVRRP